MLPHKNLVLLDCTVNLRKIPNISLCFTSHARVKQQRTQVMDAGMPGSSLI